ncbi:MAG: exosortase-associated EpsI family protein [Deltaproteobacteria bacterium]|jgi:exosortase|nr:exosortase-associated EpsI family protein [Deltaproteobacteria bacterium]
MRSLDAKASEGDGAVIDARSPEAKRSLLSLMISPTILLIVWIGLLSLAHRAALGFVSRSRSEDPLEAFFFETGTTIPALHYALFAFICWQRRHGLRAALTSPSAPVSGLGVSLLGLALFGWARVVDQVDLQVDSLVLLIAGAALCAGGWRLLDQLALPLCLLWLARPWPPMIVHPLHEWLQVAGGSFAQIALTPFGEIGRSGHLLSFGGRLFEVIEGCSGLRLTITLVTATLVYADFLSRSRWQTLGLTLLAVAIGLVVNGLRIVSIMLNPLSEVAQVHSTQGLIAVSVGIVVLAGLDRLADHRVWPSGDRSWRRASARPRGAGLERPRLLGALIPLSAAALSVLLGALPLQARPPQGEVWPLHEIRPEIGPWQRSKTYELDLQYFGSVRFRDKIHREYRKPDRPEPVMLFVTADDRRRRDRSSLSPKTLRLGADWEILSSEPLWLDSLGEEATRTIQRRGREQVLSLHYRIGEGLLLAEALRWLWALDQSPRGWAEEILTVRVSVPLDPRNPTRALATLDDFQRELEQTLQRARPQRPEAG